MAAKPYFNWFNILSSRLLMVSPKLNMDWEALKRVPQIVKRRAKLGTNTFDEEFSLLHEDLVRLDKRLEALLKYAKVVGCETKTVIAGLELIGQSFREFYNPLGGLPAEVKDRLQKDFPTDELFGDERQRLQFQHEYYNWENAKLFIDGVKDIIPAVEIELDQLVDLIVTKATELQKVVKNIKNRCREFTL